MFQDRLVGFTTISIENQISEYPDIDYVIKDFAERKKNNFFFDF